jgi:hypothetical protein
MNSTDLHVFQKYAHLFWIPLFPIGKTGVTQCDHCKKVYTVNEMPSSIRQAYESLKKQTKTPIWTYIGGAIFGFYIVLSVFSDFEKKENSAKYIKNLFPNDILETKTIEGHYTYIKVQNVMGDSIDLRENKQEVLFESALDKSSFSETSFRDELYRVSVKTILKKFEEGTILNVIRMEKK